MARAFRAAATADHARAAGAMDRIAAPLYGRLRLGQTPSPGAFARLAATWRDQVPAQGRLNLSTSTAPRRLLIVETRAIPGTFRFEAWDDEAAETAMAVTRTVLSVSIDRFNYDTVVAASVPLHALGRRMQRGWINSDAAIRADLHALALPREDVLAAGGTFSIAVADGGRWVGAVTEIQDRGATVRILVVRSFISADMDARNNPNVDLAEVS